MCEQGCGMHIVSKVSNQHRTHSLSHSVRSKAYTNILLCTRVNNFRYVYVSAVAVVDIVAVVVPSLFRYIRRVLLRIGCVFALF